MSTLFSRSALRGETREIALIAGLFLIAAVASLALSQQQGVMAAAWLPNALAMAGLARIPRARWLVLLAAIGLANLLANQLFGFPLRAGLFFLPPNLLEIIVGALLLQKLRGDLDFFSAARDTVKLLVLIFAVPIVGASIGIATASLNLSGSGAEHWLLWYTGDLIGLLGLLPLSLAIDNKSLRNLRATFRHRLLPLLALTLLITYVAVTHFPYPFSYIAIPLMIAGLYLQVLDCLLLSGLNTLFIIVLIALNLYQPPQLNGIFKGSLLYLPLALTIVPPLFISVIMRINRRERRRLRDSEERWKYALESGQEGVWDLDVPSRQLYVSNAWRQVFGMQPDEPVADLNNWNAHVHPDDVAAVRQKFEAHLRGETAAYSSQHRMRCSNGDYKWVHNRGQVMARDRRGAPLRMIGTVTDISTYRQTQLAMAKLSERIALATDAGGIGIWEWDIDSDVLVWDNRMFELYGLSPHAVQPTYPLWLNCVHPLDREHADSLIRDAVEHGTRIDTEFRICWPNGEVRYINALAAIVRDATGKAIRLVGTNWDISAMRRMTEALHEEKERLHVTLYSIAEAVITTDEKARVTFMNPVAETMTGWTLYEATGRSIEEVFPVADGDGEREIAHPVIECLNNRRVLDFDDGLVLVNRIGERHDIQNSAAPVRTLSGAIIGVVLVSRNVTEARALIRKLSFNAAHDPLTGLFNRAQFEIELARALSDARDRRALHALCFIDLDRFKIVNDSAGHAVGDMLLRELSRLLRRHIRAADTLARLGGDEFGLLMRDCEPEKACEILDKLIADIVALRFPWEGRVYNIGASVGLAVIDASATTTTDLVAQADIACYAAKRAGGNCVSIARPTGGVERPREIVSVQELRSALVDARFVLYAQTIAPLQSSEPTAYGCELLLRMLDVNGVAILPGGFMAAAVRFGLMAEIDRWVLREVLERQAAQLTKLAQPTFNINLSAASIKDPQFLAYVLDLLDRSSLGAGAIQFEISETTMMSSLTEATQLIANLRERGCKVALDNFGSGLGAFYYLKNFRIDTIKIDGSFVRNMVHNPIDRTLVEAIHNVARQLAVVTVAECVESKDTLKLLRSLGLDYAQGNAIAPPQPLAELLAAQAGGAKAEPLRIIPKN